VERDLDSDLVEVQADKAALVNIIRAKMGPDESLYVRLTQKHARLRQELVRLGRPAA
jgi:hypothetical protein